MESSVRELTPVSHGQAGEIRRVMTTRTRLRFSNIQYKPIKSNQRAERKESK